MKFSATQIAGILEGKVEGNPNVEVWNVAKIEEGAPGMISFFANLNIMSEMNQIIEFHPFMNAC